MNRYEYEAYLNGINNNFYEIDNFQKNMQIPCDEKYYIANNAYNLPNHKNFNQNIMMFDINEGFEKGNMFKNLYEQYKNYKPKDLKPKNEEEEILLRIDNLSFAMHEINLYLSVYPNDTNMINNYNELQKEYNKNLIYYESKFGPLQSNNSFMTTAPFAWTEDTWPWDRRDF